MDNLTYFIPAELNWSRYHHHSSAEMMKLFVALPRLLYLFHWMAPKYREITTGKEKLLKIYIRYNP